MTAESRNSRSGPAVDFLVLPCPAPARARVRLDGLRPLRLAVWFMVLTPESSPLWEGHQQVPRAGRPHRLLGDGPAQSNPASLAMPLGRACAMHAFGNPRRVLSREK